MTVFGRSVRDMKASPAAAVTLDTPGVSRTSSPPLRSGRLPRRLDRKRVASSVNHRVRRPFEVWTGSCWRMACRRARKRQTAGAIWAARLAAISRLMRAARPGADPLVDTAICTEPRRSTEANQKSHWSGTSATLTGISRARAVRNTVRSGFSAWASSSRRKMKPMLLPSSRRSSKESRCPRPEPTGP